MARFEFRLKALLTVREAARDLARGQLAESLGQLDALNLQRERWERELDDQKAWVRQGAAPGRIDVDRLVTASRYGTVIRREIEAIDERQQALDCEIERRRLAVMEADREVRVLEKLRDRQLEQFRQQQALAEVKLLDEVAGKRLKAEG
jgi:flagellar FliJ protein